MTGGFGKLSLVLGLGALLAVSACGRYAVRSNDPVFDGQRFGAAVKSASRRDRANFTVTVRDVAKSLDGAREAARYEAAKHCLRFFGTSEADWIDDPDAPADALRLENGSLVLSGVCRDQAG